jgi:hypothetical protein
MTMSTFHHAVVAKASKYLLPPYKTFLRKNILPNGVNLRYPSIKTCYIIFLEIWLTFSKILLFLNILLSTRKKYDIKRPKIAVF